MKCNLSRIELQQFLAGELHGEAARQVRSHLAECPSCTAGLSPLQRTELLPAVDDSVEPSSGIEAAFRARLQAHRSRQLEMAPVAWWKNLVPAGIAGRMALAGSVAALLLAGVLLRVQRPAPSAPAADISIAADLPLYQDMGVIRNLDLLEDFDDIEGMAEHDAGTK